MAVLKVQRVILTIFTYDGDGNRIMKSNGKTYWYGAGTEILDESDGSGIITSEYVFFGGKRVARRDVASGYIYYYEEDMLGSSRTLVQAGQTSLCYDADFFPFGGELQITTTCSQNYKFEGKERDTETGNDDFGARYYSSVYGRWLSADWSAVPAPVPYANMSNPQTLNLYAMVSDNPETFADLDGHWSNQASYSMIWGCNGDLPHGCPDPNDDTAKAEQNADDAAGHMTASTQPTGNTVTTPQNSPAQNQQSQGQQQSGTQLVVTPDAGQVHIKAGGYQQVVDYKLDTMDAKGKVSTLSDKDASKHKVELKEKLVNGVNVQICTGQCVTHGTLTDIMQVGGGESHSVIKRFEIDDRAARIYDPVTKRAYDFVRVDATSKYGETPFVFTYGNDPK